MTDITEHKWSDKNLNNVVTCGDGKEIAFIPTKFKGLKFDKSDAIVIAQHFGLISSEEKEYHKKIWEETLEGLNNLAEKGLI